MQQMQMFIFLIHILLISFGDTNEITRNMRWLIEGKEESCSNVVQGYEPIRSFDTLNAYVVSLKIPDTGANTFILSLITDGSAGNLTSFLEEIVVYIVMIGFAVIVVLFWPGMCICCCCQCCIFSRAKGTGCCALTNLIFAYACLAIVVIASAVGLSQSTKFVQYFNGSICALLTLLDDGLTGEKSSTVPRWGGPKGISDLLKSSQKPIKSLTTTPIANSENEFDTHYDQTFKDLKTSYKKQISYPEETDQKITPKYVELFQDGQEFSIEKKEIIDEPLKLIKRFNDALVLLKVGGNIVETTTEILTKALDDVNTLLRNLTDKLANTIVNIQKIASEIILLVFQIIYGLFLSFTVASCIILVLYTCLEVYCLKCVLHVFWNVLFLMSIISFIIGAAIGLFGVIGEQIIPVVDHIFTSEFLNSGVFGDTGGEMLNTCFNGDGEMFPTINTGGNNIFIADIIDSSLLADGFIKRLKEKPTTTAIQNTIQKINAYENDIDSTSPTYKTAVDAINKKLKDIFECTESYYLKKQPVNGDEILDLTSPPKTSCGSDQVQTNLDTALKMVYDSAKENKDLITEIDGKMNSLKIKHNDLVLKLTQDLDEIKTRTIPVAQEFSSMGSQSFGDMLNCSFMKYDIITFLDQLGHKFVNQCITISTSCFVCAYLSFIGVFFMSRTIGYYSKEARDIANEENAKIEADNNGGQKADVQDNASSKKDPSTKDPLGYQAINVQHQ